MPPDLFLAILSCIAGGALLFYGFSRMKKYMLINDTPTSKIRAVAMGLVEIGGAAVSKEYLKTPFSNNECVYYKYEVKEYREHTSVSKGRTTRSYSWDTIDSGEKRMPFFIADETGTIYVNPENAEFNVPIKKEFIEKAGLFKRAYSREGNHSLAEIPVNKITFLNKVGDRKYFESYLSPNENIYILGTADSYSGKAFIHQGQNDKNFIISTRSEKELLKAIRWQMIGGFAAGVALFLWGVHYFF